MATPDATIIRTRPRGPHSKAVRLDAQTAHALTSMARQLEMRAADVVVIALRILAVAQGEPDRKKAERRNNLNAQAQLDAIRRQRIRAQLWQSERDQAS